MSTPPVTVVVITRDRRASTLRTVETLRRLPERPPIVVVDNGSTDGTVDALRGRPGVTVVAAGRNLGSAGRTVGVRLATTQYVAFSDDDSWWAPGSLARAAALLDSHPRLAVLVGRTLVGDEQRADPIDAALAAAPAGRAADLPGPTALGFLACASVVRRAAYLEVGGFHARFGVGGEEQLLALDLLARGWGLAHVPSVVAHHHPEPGPTRAGRPARQGRNDLWTLWLRRSPGVVLRRTADLVWRARRDPQARAVLRLAVPGLPWVMGERRPVPRRVEALARDAERAGLPLPAPG